CRRVSHGHERYPPRKVSALVTSSGGWFAISSVNYPLAAWSDRYELFGWALCEGQATAQIAACWFVSFSVSCQLPIPTWSVSTIRLSCGMSRLRPRCSISDVLRRFGLWRRRDAGEAIVLRAGGR